MQLTAVCIVLSTVVCYSVYLYQGRSYPFDACGRAFVSLPMCQPQSCEQFSGIVTNLDLLLETVTTQVLVNLFHSSSYQSHMGSGPAMHFDSFVDTGTI